MTRATSQQVSDRLREIMTWAIGESREFTKAQMETALGLSKSQSRDAIEELVKRGNLVRMNVARGAQCHYAVGLTALVPTIKEKERKVVNEWHQQVKREPARNAGAVRHWMDVALFGDGPARVMA